MFRQSCQVSFETDIPVVLSTQHRLYCLHPEQNDASNIFKRNKSNGTLMEVGLGQKEKRKKEARPALY